MSLTDHQQGTNDTLNGTFVYGDAYSMYDDSEGGNDRLTGVDNVPLNTLYGDASEMHDNSRRGNDTLVGGDNVHNNLLYGDANYMYGNAVGGYDTLIGGAGNNYFYGHASACTTTRLDATTP
jgi:hypothetical protein